MLNIGLVVGGLCMVLIAFSTEDWMAYVGISLYVVGWGVVGPAARAIASRAVGRDEQGILQGAITSLTTATGVIGPPIAAGLFGYFVGPSDAGGVPGGAVYSRCSVVRGQPHIGAAKAHPPSNRIVGRLRSRQEEAREPDF